MVIVVRGFVAVALLAGSLSWSAKVAATAEQSVTAIQQAPEQRIEGIAPPGEQRVENLTAAEAEQAVNGTTPKTGSQRAASTAGKIALGVMAAVVSIATMVASLLFF